MRIVLLAALAFISPTAALAKDQFDRPELTVPKDVAKLSILFSDSANWNGKNVPRVMQCERIGGKSPASPALTISGEIRTALARWMFCCSHFISGSRMKFDSVASDASTNFCCSD